MTKRLVVLASGSGTNLQAILNACQEGEIPAKVVAVISNRKTAYALDRARLHNIPTVYHSWKSFQDADRARLIYDEALANKTADFEPDYIILAGWMHLLTIEDPIVKDESGHVVDALATQRVDPQP